MGANARMGYTHGASMPMRTQSWAAFSAHTR